MSTQPADMTYNDLEFKSISEVSDALKCLDDQGKRRVLEWALDKYWPETPKKKTPKRYSKP
jgi:hypothetical protein